MGYLISAVIPVYNCEKYVRNAIDSVLSQSNFSEIELILVDDGSTDNSGAICDEYAEKYENILAIHQNNSGVSVARNNGIKNSTGKWISFIDSDDYIKDDFYVKMLTQSNAELICCDFCSNGIVDSRLTDYFKKRYYTKDEFNTSIYSAMVNMTSFFPCWNKIYLKSIIDDNNLQFAPGVKLGEDMMFVFDYVRHIKSFAFIEEPLYFYYINPDNTTSVIKKGFEKYLYQFEWQYNYFNSIDCDSELLLEKVRSSFVFRTVMAISSAGYELKMIDGIKYIKNIVMNDTFYKLYLHENYTEFVSKFDEVLNKFIRKRKPCLIYFLIKISKAVSRIAGKR